MFVHYVDRQLIFEWHCARHICSEQSSEYWVSAVGW